MQADWILDEDEKTGPGYSPRPSAKVTQMVCTARFLPLPLSIESFDAQGTHIEIHRATPSDDIVMALGHDVTLLSAMARNGEWYTFFVDFTF